VAALIPHQGEMNDVTDLVRLKQARERCDRRPRVTVDRPRQGCVRWVWRGRISVR